LGRKDNLWRNFKKFKRKHPLDYNYHPQAFIIPEELSEFKLFSKMNPSFAWIVKPQASSRGRGIRLLTSFEDISKECLICRYIEKP
ncbi:tubulin--tyrosine ligase family protein, partial [Salmonella enterica]|nr:tubulin--tyrosine ligase family protein [Salmonella enterica]